MPNLFIKPAKCLLVVDALKKTIEINRNEVVELQKEIDNLTPRRALIRVKERDIDTGASILFNEIGQIPLPDKETQETIRILREEIKKRNIESLDMEALIRDIIQKC